MGGSGAPGLAVFHMPSPSIPSTLRSPSSPIHEEDEEKLSEDLEAPLPPGGPELALGESSSPEVRLNPGEACPMAPQVCDPSLSVLICGLGCHMVESREGCRRAGM